MKTKMYYKVESSGKNNDDYMLVEVEKVDEMKLFGRDIWTVKPVAGKGELSVNLDSLIIK